MIKILEIKTCKECPKRVTHGIHWFCSEKKMRPVNSYEIGVRYSCEDAPNPVLEIMEKEEAMALDTIQCPECKSAALVIRYKDGNFRVVCTKNACYRTTALYRTELEAIHVWNTMFK